MKMRSTIWSMSDFCFYSANTATHTPQPLHTTPHTTHASTTTPTHNKTINENQASFSFCSRENCVLVVSAKRHTARTRHTSSTLFVHTHQHHTLEACAKAPAYPAPLTSRQSVGRDSSSTKLAKCEIDGENWTNDHVL